MWICLHPDQHIRYPAPLLQLETRYHGGSSGCIPTGLGPTEGFYQPTVVLNWQSPEPGTPPASPTSAGSTSVEGSNLVTSNTKDGMGLPQTDSFSPRSNSETNRCPSGDGPSTSCVACLQERLFSSSSLLRRLLSSCCSLDNPSQPNPTTHNSTK